MSGMEPLYHSCYRTHNILFFYRVCIQQLEMRKTIFKHRFLPHHHLLPHHRLLPHHHLRHHHVHYGIPGYQRCLNCLRVCAGSLYLSRRSVDTCSLLSAASISLSRLVESVE